MLEPARLAKPPSEKRGCAATMESIAGRTGRACASGTLGMNFGMVDFANLTTKLSGGEAVRLNAGLGASMDSYAASSIYSTLLVGSGTARPSSSMPSM